MTENYKIELGVKLNDQQLNTVKTTINNLVDKERKINLDIDFNIKNANKLADVGREIEVLKKQLKELNNIDFVGKGKGKSILSVDSESLKKSINTIHEDIKKLQSAFGKVDKNKGVQSLLTTVNKIRAALEGVTKQFEDLNKNLTALSSKDFSFKFGFDMSGNKSSPEQLRSELNQLQAIAKEYENWIVKNSKNYSKSSQIEPMVALAQRAATVNSPNLTAGKFHQLQAIIADNGTSDAKIRTKIDAYKQYISLIRELGEATDLPMASVEQRLAESGKFTNITNDIKNEAKDAQEELKRLFGSINADELSVQLKPISDELSEIKKALTELPDGSPLKSLIDTFDRLSNSIESLLPNITTVKNTLGDGLNVTVADGNTDKAIREQKELAQVSTQTADTVAKSGEKIQQSYKKMSAGATSVSGLDSLELKDDITEADRLTAALSKLKNIQSQIGKIDTGKISASKNVQELKTLESQLESLSAEYNETVAEINGMGGVSATQLQSFENQIRTTELTIERLQSKLKSEIKLKISTDVANQISKAHTDFDNLSNKTNDLKQKLDLLDNIKVDLDTAAANDDIDGLQERYRELVRTLKDFDVQLQITKRNGQSTFNAQSLDAAKADALSRLEGLFESGSQAAKIYATKVEELRNEINRCGSTKEIGIVNKQITTLGREIDNAKIKTQTFSQSLRDQWEHYKSYLSVASLISYGTQALRSMFEQVKLIDSAMTELKKVTNETDEAYNKFLTNAADRAKAIGTTIDGLVSSTADFARLGYGFEDAQGLAEVANIYAVVGDEIEGVEGATESLISTMAAFKDSATGMSNSDFAMSIVDKFNEIGNNFAISSGGIGQALERSASSLDAANNTLDESIALITAANTVVQDPAQVGTAFKTISMRMKIHCSQ